MKKRITSWGKDAEGKKHFFTFDLQVKENKVNGTITAGDALTQEMENLLNNQWREGGEVQFPDSTTAFSKELTVTESVLPEGYVLDNAGLLKRSQTEWNFMVMSQKLADLYQQEAEDFKEKIDQLTSFDNGVWESLKTYWSKVNQQIREKNLLRKHANELHDHTNELFDKMKTLRKKMDNEFREISEKNKQKISEVMDEIENKINSGLSLQPLFNQLKKVQAELKKTELTKSHRRKLWDRIDKAFKTVKAKRYGDEGGSQKSDSAKSRLQHRYDGLIEVIERMERSIQRDRNDLQFQTKRINTTAGQLEAEIRKAKTQMIEERIASKQAKLDDMKRTKTELEARLEKEKAREAEAAAKREEKEKIKKAKAEIEQKIAEEINEAQVTKEQELDKLLQAAEAINSSRKAKANPKQKSDTKETKTKEGDGELRVSEFLADKLEDIVDTARAVAAVVGRKIDDAVEDITSSIEEEE